MSYNYSETTLPINLQDVEFIIYCSIDTQERAENLKTVLTCADYCYNTTITVVEMKHNDEKLKEIVDSFDKVSLLSLPPGTEINRGIAINYAVQNSTKDIVVVHDSDVFFKTWRMKEAIDVIRKGNYKYAFPYNGHFYNIPHSLWEKICDIKNIDSIDHYADFDRLHSQSVGGGFIFDRKTFIAGGGINENLKSWGPGDIEMVDRFKILGFSFYRTMGSPCLHLSHPKNPQGWYDPKKKDDAFKEYNKIRYMNKENLLDYISTWKWQKGQLPKKPSNKSTIEIIVEKPHFEYVNSAKLDKEKFAKQADLSPQGALLHAFLYEYFENKRHFLEKGFVLYGCGEHTYWLLQFLENIKLKPSLLINDDPVPPFIQGIPTSLTEELDSQNIETVIISSDTFHQKMHLKLSNKFPSLKILNPYAYLPQGPFLKI